MKVLLVNANPHEKGCTYAALEEVAKTLKAEGLETEIFQLGTKPLSGCIDCGNCRTTGRCIFSDRVNDFLDIAKDADGFVFGSSVHDAAAEDAIASFLDRVFFSAFCSGNQIFYLKPAASIVSAERAGTTATFDRLIKYFTLSEMPIISSKYWNLLHGFIPEDEKIDLDGLPMRILGRNMAWFLKCKEAGIKAEVTFPERGESKS